MLDLADPVIYELGRLVWAVMWTVLYGVGVTA